MKIVLVQNKNKDLKGKELTLESKCWFLTVLYHLKLFSVNRKVWKIIKKIKTFNCFWICYKLTRNGK